MQMQYPDAEATLAAAEMAAWEARDYDTLGRLYMPLQEARRQRRQQCGEGTIRLDLIAQGPDDVLDGARIITNFPHGQLLVAGWGSIEPAKAARRLQAEHRLYVEVLLAAVYPLIGGARAVAIVPTDEVRLPDPIEQPIDALLDQLPAHCIVLSASDLPAGARQGDWKTYAEVMSLWERLHAPFLASADETVDPVRRMEEYRRTIRVDYACELAHQKLSDVAKDLARRQRETGRTR